MDDDEVLSAIRASFGKDVRLGHDLTIETLELASDGTLTLAGEVASVAEKKRALEIAAAPAEVRGVVDRLRVAVASPMSDEEILQHLLSFYLPEPAFEGFAIRAAEIGPQPVSPDFPKVLREPDEPEGRIDLEVRDGVVILNGEVPGRVSQRLAGVMAWWVPGVRDVVNGLAPMPPEEDAPIRIEEAVRVVLDRNPYVDDSQIRIGVRDRTVRLTGLVRNVAERDMAESDAFCVLGVDAVVNELEVSG
jgi:osmotically-inducible protein OsmY